MTTDRELLPCPFCGSDDLGFVIDDTDLQFVECMNCGWTGPYGTGLQDTSEKWNRRAAASIGQQMEK